jgi:hypothetical protein
MEKGPSVLSTWDNSTTNGHNEDMNVRVECYAGRKDSERPVRFLVGDRSYDVEDVLDQWYGPEHLFFKVRADDGNVYILRHDTSAPDGEWELVSFRSERG